MLERIDARAKALNVSRNRLVVASLRRTLEAKDEWSPEFLRALDGLSEDDEVSRAVDEMLRAIRSPVSAVLRRKAAPGRHRARRPSSA